MDAAKEVIDALLSELPRMKQHVRIERQWVWIATEATAKDAEDVEEVRSTLKEMGFRFKRSGDRIVEGTPCRWAHNCGKPIPSQRNRRRASREDETKTEQPKVSASESPSLDLSYFWK